MKVIIFLIILGTTIWVGVDLSNIIKRIKNNNSINAPDRFRIGSMDTLRWVIGCFLLWIVVFPLYLYKRSKLLSFLSSIQSIKNKPKQCPACQKYYDGDPSFCPNCGSKLNVGL